MYYLPIGTYLGTDDTTHCTYNGYVTGDEDKPPRDITGGDGVWNIEEKKKWFFFLKNKIYTIIIIIKAPSVFGGVRRV